MIRCPENPTPPSGETPREKRPLHGDEGKTKKPNLDYYLVYFVYPETCGVRLEEMDAIFGDATNAMGTPATMGTPALHAEGDALMRTGSPIPSLDIRGRAGFGSAAAIPGLGIDPPNVDDEEGDGKPQQAQNNSGHGGIGGWFSRVVGRGRQKSGDSSNGGRYAPLGQGED